jgi:hypothetical protein
MIYLIITTCIIESDKNYEHRKKRYIDCIGNLLKIVKQYRPNKIKPIVVENNGERLTYLNDLINTEEKDPLNILYTNNNSKICKHKGVKELFDIKDVIKAYNIKDDDIIIKITGRYKLLNENFFKILLENEKYDAFIKFFNVCTLKFNPFDCVLGLFAIRCKYIKNFNYQCIKSPEIEFATYVKKNIKNIINIMVLNLECCFADNLRILNV